MILVVSHPPHGDAVDLALAAPVLGLDPPDVRLKSHYPVPEIWLALPEPAAAASAAERLREAELRVAIVPGAALAAIPARNPLQDFAFEGAGMRLSGAGTVTLPYDAQAVAVAFTPRQTEGREHLPPAFLDLYAMVDRGLSRWTVVQGVSGFAGMGERQTASFGTNVHALTAELEAHFPHIVVDHRLVNMQVRLRTGTPPPGVRRRGYSYATASLNAVLEGIAPGLAELDHDELTARLAFLTHAAA